MRKKRLLSLLLVGAQLATLVSAASLAGIASAASPTDQVLDFVEYAKTTKYVGDDYNVTVNGDGITITLTKDIIADSSTRAVSCGDTTTVAAIGSTEYPKELNEEGTNHYVALPVKQSFDIKNNQYFHADVVAGASNSVSAGWSFGIWYEGDKADSTHKNSARYTGNFFADGTANSIAYKGLGSDRLGDTWFYHSGVSYKDKGLSAYLYDRSNNFVVNAAIIKVVGKSGDSFTFKTLAFGPEEITAAATYEMTAAKLTSVPTIDGKISDWGTLGQDMAAGAQGKDKAKFDVKHDNDNIYIAAQVSNHTGAVTAASGWEQGDIISVYFDPTMHYGSLTPSTPYYDLQIGYGYNAAGTPSVLFGGNTSSEVQNAVTSKGAAKCSATSDGWILEVKIPKSALHLENAYFGFNIQAENNPNKIFINWADGADFWQSTTDYGKVTLARDPATSLTTEVKSLDIPLNTSVALTDVQFTLNGKEAIDASYYDMDISFSPEGVIAIEKGSFVGKKAGTTNITFKVDSQTVTIPATCKAIALITIDPIGDQEAYVGIEKSFTVKASASAPTTLVYSATNLPSGASFDADTHTFKWTPTAADKGTYTVTFTVADKDSSKSENVKITVKETPAITIEPVSDKITAAGKAVAFLFNATDSLGLPLSAECTNLPTGAKFSTNSGKFFFSWIPTAEQIGTYTLNFVFTNGSTSAPASVVIKVVDKLAEGINFDSISDKSINAGETVSFKVNAISSDSQPVSITTTGTLPSGAFFSAESNTFTWATSSSTSSGSYPITFRATSGEYVATLTVAIDVTNTSGSGSSSTSSSGSYGSGYGYVGSVAGTTTGTDTTAQESKHFKDMSNHSWASASVDALYEYGIVKGISEDEYAPERNISRADFVLLLIRTFNFSGDSSANFSDVNASAYYAKEVAIARSVGLVNGSGDNRFNPAAPITRQDMMVMLNRALQIAGLASLDASEYVIASYDDTANIASYATQAVANMVSANLIAGSDNKLMPAANTTRAEIAVILHRMLLKYGTALLN